MTDTEIEREAEKIARYRAPSLERDRICQEIIALCARVRDEWFDPDDVPAEYHSTAEKIIPVLVSIPHYSRYPVIGWYYTIISEWRMSGSPSSQHPTGWRPLPPIRNNGKEQL